MTSCAPRCGPCYTPARERLNLFEILLDRQSEVYRSGDIVTGNIRIKVAKEWDINGISIRHFGFAKTEWSVGESSAVGEEKYLDTRRTVMGQGITIRFLGSAEVKWFIQEVTLKNEEIYVDRKRTVLGTERGKGSANISLRQGDVYKFPFSFRLPESIPMSLESENGYIRYGVTCHMYALVGEDLSLTKVIKVNGTVDLNNIPEAKGQKVVEEHIGVKRMCCTTGGIRATLQIDRAGYIPGEGIQVSGEIVNRCSTMCRSQIKIKQIIHYFSDDGMTTMSVKDYCKRSGGIVFGGSTHSWDGTVLKVPDVIPSSLEPCQIMLIRYVLQMTVTPAGACVSTGRSRLKIPLEIGTIPLLGKYVPYEDLMQTSNAKFNIRKVRRSEAFKERNNNECEEAGDRKTKGKRPKFPKRPNYNWRSFSSRIYMNPKPKPKPKRKKCNILERLRRNKKDKQHKSTALEVREDFYENTYANYGSSYDAEYDENQYKSSFTYGDASKSNVQVTSFSSVDNYATWQKSDDEDD